MAGTDVVTLGAAVASDVLSGLSFPGGSTLELIASAHLAKRRKEAADILIAEIRTGRHGPVNFEEEDIDPLIEIVLRFSKAVGEGAARENLILLAQVIAGLKKHRALQGDQFRKWAGILEHLTRDELLVIGTAYVIAERFEAAGTDINEYYKTLLSELELKGYGENEAYALLASISRTGLLAPVSGWGTLIFRPGPWLKELGTLADLEAMITR
jgi:hypothetical protein